jgi:hypothetical protein
MIPPIERNNIMQKKFYIFNFENDKLVPWKRQGFDSETEAMQEIEKVRPDYLGTVKLTVLPFWTR